MQTGLEGRRKRNSSAMAFSGGTASPPILVFFFAFLLVAAAAAELSPVAVNSTIPVGVELSNMRRIRARLKRLNKPPVKTIKSPEGDLIDCVPSYLQPAFDHPMLKGQRPLGLPERPNGLPPPNLNATEILQWWVIGGESCPENTVPVRRTTTADVLRASSVKRFAKKPAMTFQQDSSSGGHEHAVGYVMGGTYYGVKASMNVWSPGIASPSEFSLSQVWVIAGSFGHDLNSIEAGWQVSPELYGDSHPRFFTYWTATGCYNLLCSGFVQTNNKIAIGAAISPVSTFNGGQFDITLLIWKDPKHGNWWLELGPGLLVGYWPSFLFSHLASHASMVQFGGEVVNTRLGGAHTATQMGSGHFSSLGFRRAAYFRNLQLVDADNSLVVPSNLHLLADRPLCYGIIGGVNSAWGKFFFYGGPGRNPRCP
ncbi:protein neprosin-like isoform X2 [Wolffia australiana]